MASLRSRPIIAAGSSVLADDLGLYYGGSVVVFVEALQGAPAALPITVTAQVTGSEWSGTLTDTVHVIAAEPADLQIHMPTLLDMDERMVPQEDELTKGSMTFVNLDNDDMDQHFDNSPQDDGVIGDDELVRVRVQFTDPFNTPLSQLDDKLRLVATSGQEQIRVWKTANKAPGSEYALGDPLNVSEAVAGGWDGYQCSYGWVYSRDLWVEGITPQTLAQPGGTRLQLQLDAPRFGRMTDEAALTVLGIQSVEWVFPHASQSTVDRNWPAGLNVPHTAIFPDADSLDPTSLGGQARDAVFVRTKLTAVPPYAVDVHLAWLDVDDPSAADDPVDYEDDVDDNRGSAGFGSARTRSATIRFDANDYGATVEGEQTEYFVSMSPGDNFRVVANADRGFIDALRNNDFTQNVTDGGGTADENKQRIVDPMIAGATVADREVRNPANYVSPTLTVWRKLHVKIDSMQSPGSDDLAFSTYIESVRGLQNPWLQIEGITTDSNGAWTEVTVSAGGYTSGGGPVAVGLSDGSPNLDHGDEFHGNFEGGRLRIGTVQRQHIVVDYITGNGDHILRFPATSVAGLEFYAEDGDPLFHDPLAGTVTKIVRDPDPQNPGLFVWYVNGQIPGTWQNGGKVKVGGQPDNAPWMDIVHVEYATNTFKTNSLRIPFELWEDDYYADWSILPYPVSGQTALDQRFVDAYRSAYVEVIAMPGQSDVPFQSHAEPDATLLAACGGSLVNRRPAYWIAHAVWGWQLGDFEAMLHDGDPSDELGSHILARGGGQLGTALIALETIRECCLAKGLSFSDVAWHAIAHELGHEFGLDHLPGGLMGESSEEWPFAPADLDKIRSGETDGSEVRSVDAPTGN